MNSYTTEQLTRQRRDQFAREAYGGHLIRMARGATPLSQPGVGPSPARRLGGLIWRFGEAVLAGISRTMRQRSSGATGPHGA